MILQINLMIDDGYLDESPSLFAKAAVNELQERFITL